MSPTPDAHDPSTRDEPEAGLPRLLLIEESEADFLLLQRHLDRHGPAVAWHRVHDPAGLEAALAETWDLALVDYVVPGLDFHTLIDRLRSAQPELSILLVTGALSENMAVELLSLDLADCVLKHNLARLPAAVARTLTVAAERRARLASESRYRLLLEQLPDGVFLADAEGHYLDVNQAGTALLGYTREEIQTLCIPDIIEPDEAARLPSEIARFAGGAVVTSEWRFRRKDGSVFPGEVVGRRLPDGRLQGVLRDISARARHEAALRHREMQLRLFIEHAPAALAMFDCDMRYLAVSRRWKSDYGLLDRDLTGLCHYTVFPEIPERWKEIHRRALVGEVIRAEEDRFERADGQVHWLRWEVRPWHEADGSLGGMVALSEDITAQHDAAAALRESEFFYRQTLESIPGMVFTTRPDGYCDYQSQQWVDYTGVPMSEHLGDGWNALLHPEDRPRAYAAWQDAVAGRAPYELEYRVRRHDGMYEWFRVIGRPILDANGRIARWFGVAVNIDRLKQLGAELEGSEALLRTITENIPSPLFVLNRDHTWRYLNPVALATTQAMHGKHLTLEAILGKTALESFGDDAVVRKRMAQDERVMALDMVDQSEIQMPDPEGNRTILVTRVPLHGSGGRVVGMTGLAHDITERKQAEAERLAALERQRDALVREVHHRIKNHLQGVAGLLHNSATDHPHLADALAPVLAQVRVIAQVYGLQSHRAGACVRLGALTGLVAETATAPVVFQTETDAAFDLTEEDAIPLALVVNELITNAIKHRADADPARPVRVRLHEDRETARLEIAAGSARLPAGFDFTGGRGLGTGLELVSTLLPSGRARLTYRQVGDEVVAELVLRLPG